MSKISYWNFSPCVYPLAQLLPAPPPSFDMKMFSGLYRFECEPVWIVLMTWNSHKLYSGFEIDEDWPWHVMIVVGLVEEDVFSVFSLNVRCVVFQNSFGVDAVLLAELFPELRADCVKGEITLVSALTDRDCDYLSGHLSVYFNFNWFSNFWFNYYPSEIKIY